MPRDGDLDMRLERLRLRRSVIIAGRVLGWDFCHVVSFAEALTSVPWERCGNAELLMVLDEYRAIMDAIDARMSRGAARPREGAS